MGLVLNSCRIWQHHITYSLLINTYLLALSVDALNGWLLICLSMLTWCLDLIGRTDTQNTEDPSQIHSRSNVCFTNVTNPSNIRWHVGQKVEISRAFSRTSRLGMTKNRWHFQLPCSNNESRPYHRGLIAVPLHLKASLTLKPRMAEAEDGTFGRDGIYVRLHTKDLRS